MNDIYTVKVEWLDGEVREYTVGGYGTRHVEEDQGTLYLRIGNNAYMGPQSVAMIPLCNVRVYKRVNR